MVVTIPLFPQITLRCITDTRFKQNCLSVQFIRPMRRQETAYNALLPAVLLRGTEKYPDLQKITLHLDNLYGASAGALVRRIGDYQTTGLYCSFLQDRYTLEQDAILAPMLDFIRQLLLNPVTELGVFRTDYLESEKKNLISTVESQRNDKRAYANAQLLRHMCSDDAFGLSRLGETQDIAAITAHSLWQHYKKVLLESPVNLFYVGAAQPEQVADLLRPVFAELQRQPVALPPQTGFSDPPAGYKLEQMEVAQGKLCVGYTSEITLRDSRFAAMQVANVMFGGGMSSKLFLNAREKLNLCYDIGSGYYGSKGIVTVCAGIAFEKETQVCQEIDRQLEALCQGDFTEEELLSAKKELASQLQSVSDSPAAVENYYSTAACSGLGRTPQQYLQQVEQVTAQQVAQAAQTLQKHTVYFLRGAV